MIKFKVGDRVAIYDKGKRQVGVLGAIDDKSLNFRVDVVSSRECVARTSGWFHHKQCRRLKKKVARDWWLSVFDDGSGSCFTTKSEAIEDFRTSINTKSKVIHVREVFEKKGKA